MTLEPKRDGAKRRLTRDSVARLRARYDGLLESPPAAIDAAHLDELRALALVYDLDAAASADPAELWRGVRAVIMRLATDETTEPAERTPLTVLVVEDDPDVAAGLIETLTEAGHGAVGPFPNAESALAAAATHALDAALVDINLDGRATGVELARELKSRWGVASIFLSGDVTQAARHAELAVGMVFKPYVGAEVVQMLDQAAADGRLAA